MRDDRVYLTHILECIQNIEEYAPEGRDQFKLTTHDPA